MKEMEITGREKTKKIQLKMKKNRIGFLILSQPKSFEHLIFTRIPFICILRSEGEPEVFTHYDSVGIVSEQSWIKNINGIYPYNIGIDKKNDVEENHLAKTVEFITSFTGSGHGIGMDLSNTPVNILRYFKDHLKNYLIADFSVELNSILSINTAEEITLIKQAAKIAEEGVLKSKEFREDSGEGITENELAAYAEYHMRKQNISGFFVHSSVTSGYRTCQIGAADSPKVIGPDDIVNVDYSPIYKGYFADICRPLFHKPLSKIVNEKCRIIEEALDIAIGVIKPGIKANIVDRKVKEHFRDYGYDGGFIHHTGHPVGNSWGIMITSNSELIIEEGMAFALEPGLYDRGIGGIRIEDNVYVSKTGAVNMMSLPRIL